MNAVPDYPALVASVIAGADVAAAADAFAAPIEADCAGAEPILWEAWDAVVTAAARDAAAREPLVALVTAIQARDGDCRVWERRVYADLAVFGARMREAWNGPPSAELSAFAARLTPQPIDFLRFALWTIREELETFDDVSPVASAAWFEHAGPALRDATLHGRTFASGEDGFSVPRWQFWRSRLASLAETGDPAARTGLLAIRRYDSDITAG